MYAGIEHKHYLIINGALRFDAGLWCGVCLCAKYICIKNTFELQIIINKIFCQFKFFVVLILLPLFRRDFQDHNCNLPHIIVSKYIC